MKLGLHPKELYIFALELEQLLPKLVYFASLPGPDDLPDKSLDLSSLEEMCHDEVENILVLEQ